METKCLAFIWPAEDITGKEECLSNVKFLSGPVKNKIYQYQMTTSIYRYYYWGVTFEVVTIKDNGELINVRDINISDMNQFDIKVIQAYAFRIWCRPFPRKCTLAKNLGRMILIS